MKTIVWTTTLDRKEDSRKLLDDTISNAGCSDTVDFLIVPTTRIVFYSENQISSLDEDVDKDGTIVLITSKNTLEAIEGLKPLHELKQIPIITVGAKTRTMANSLGYKFHSDQSGKDLLFSNSAEALEYIENHKDIHNVIYPGAKIRAANTNLSSVKVNTIDIYESRAIPPEDQSTETLKRLNSLSNSDHVTCFSSPSSFDAFTALTSHYGVKQFAIGQTTAERLRSNNLNPITPKDPTYELLAEMVVKELSSTS